ncbi:MAG: sigma-70 family RNA polymerase sigma factor [Planctomycetaceae bacterium]|nr:MAG: sigma-70 family RNA polymerase sigma factor [Planctomycetaceae bacterium]
MLESSFPVPFAEMVAAARAGDDRALGQILSRHRPLLRLLAKVEIGRRLQGKIDASDIVQETWLEAHRGFPRFAGADEPQFLAWLKGILAHVLANTARRYFGTQARNPDLELQLAAEWDRSTMALGAILVDPGSSPSQRVMRRERSDQVLEALARLPDDYQTVLVLRHLEDLTFPVIAERMGRSVDSVEKLWLRGLTRLKREFTLIANPSSPIADAR